MGMCAWGAWKTGECLAFDRSHSMRCPGVSKRSGADGQVTRWVLQRSSGSQVGKAKIR